MDLHCKAESTLANFNICTPNKEYFSSSSGTGATIKRMSVQEPDDDYGLLSMKQRKISSAALGGSNLALVRNKTFAIGEASMNNDSGERLSVPHFTSKDHNPIKRISADTLVQMIDGAYRSVLDEVIIIDCRFDYEYLGGHIRGSINLGDQQKCKERLFSESALMKDGVNTIRRCLVFHCEYSAQRGPKMASFVRQFDREYNGLNYPKLVYPEVYVLEGGYKCFFETYKVNVFEVVQFI